MGFTSTRGASRSDIISEVTRPDRDSVTGTQYRTIAHRAVGNCLWTVKERRHVDGSAQRGIVLYLLGKRPEGWGYRDLGEDVGPFYFSCPLAYLEMVTGQDTVNPEWRQRVSEWHATQAAQRAKANALAIGQKWTLVGAKNLEWVVIGRLKPIAGQGSDGRFYRIPSKMLGECIVESAAQMVDGRWVTT